MLKVYSALAIAAVAGLLGGTALMVWNQQSNDRFAECRSATVAGGSGAIGGAFTLIDSTGKTVTDKEVLAKPSLVYFGYSFCPDVCPLDNARNVEAVDLLADKGYDVTPVFITIDPARDTPAVVKEFSANLSPKMVGLTGTEDQIKAASKAYKTYFKKQDSSDQYYLMDHSTFTYLMLPETGFADFFGRDDTAQQMADRTACFIDHS